MTEKPTLPTNEDMYKYMGKPWQNDSETEAMVRGYRQCLADQAANTEALRALGAVSWADPPEAAPKGKVCTKCKGIGYWVQTVEGGQKPGIQHPCSCQSVEQQPGLPLVPLTDEQLKELINSQLGATWPAASAIRDAQIAKNQGVVDRMLQQIAAEAMAHENTKAAIGPLVAASEKLLKCPFDLERSPESKLLWDALRSALSQVQSAEERHGS